MTFRSGLSSGLIFWLCRISEVRKSRAAGYLGSLTDKIVLPVTIWCQQNDEIVLGEHKKSWGSVSYAAIAGTFPSL